jgi:hypothetical protein
VICPEGLFWMIRLPTASYVQDQEPYVPGYWALVSRFRAS